MVKENETDDTGISGFAHKIIEFLGNNFFK